MEQLLEINQYGFVFYESESYRSYLEFYRDLVNRNSFTKDFDSIRKSQAWLAEEFKKLGCSINVHFNHENLPLLEVNWGKGKKKPITLICHIDSVQPITPDYQFRICPSDDLIFGPGVLDNKSGILFAYLVIKNLLRSKMYEESNVRIIVSPSEERGSVGFHNLYQKWGEESDYIFGLEPSEKNGDLIQSRAGNRWYELILEGPSYHSGRIEKFEKSLGNIAIENLGQLIVKTDHLSDKKLNITYLESDSDTFNTTCNQLKIRLDIRFTSHQTRDHIDVELRSIMNQVDQCEIIIHDDCPAMESSDQLEEILNVYNKNISVNQHPVKFVSCYGAADANYFSNNQNVVIDGLGAIGGNMHRKDEYVLISSIIPRTNALTKLIESLQC